MSAPFKNYFRNNCPFWEKRRELIRGRHSLNISRQKGAIILWSTRLKMNDCSCHQLLQQNLSWFLSWHITYFFLEVSPTRQNNVRRTFWGRPKKCPDVLSTSPSGPICNAKGRIRSGVSLGPTQDVNLTIIHKISF